MLHLYWQEHKQSVKNICTSTRLKNNNDNIQRILDDYRTRVGKDATPEEIGNILLQSSEEMYRIAQGSQIKSQKVVLNQLMI